jgi:histidine triad (HIT) family protein
MVGTASSNGADSVSARAVDLTRAGIGRNLEGMEETLFSKIIARKIPAKIAYEDDLYIAIYDIIPQAPVHLLVITKKVIPTLNDLTAADTELVGGMFLVASKLMKQMGHTDFRTVFNCGLGAQQSVFHLHLHVLAGRPFTWPPG